MPELQAGRRGPKGGVRVRAALLRAAAEAILEDGPDALSFRGIAGRAEVTPAMVPYYFGSRRGLLLGLLEEGFAPVLERLEEAAGSSEPLRPRDAEALLADLLVQVSERPWLPVLMARTVLASDELRGDFASRYAPRIAAAGARVLARASERGQLREGLDPRLSLLSVLAMSVFPFLARPVVESVFRLRLDEDFARAQAAHVTKLLAAEP